MKTSTKVLLISAGILVLIGGPIFAGAMTALGWDFSKLSTVEYETNTYTPDEKFADISVATDTADIELIPSDGDHCSVVCYESKTSRHTVSVENGSLVIKVNNTKKWYDHIGISFKSPKITISVPSGEYKKLYIKSDTGNVQLPKDISFEEVDISESTGQVLCRSSVSGKIRIATDTGDIRVENVTAGELDLSVSTGKVTVSDVICTGDLSINVSTGKTELSRVECKNLRSDGSTGSIILTSVIAAEKLFVERSTGSIRFDGSDAAEIIAVTDTGDIKGTLLSEKVFITETSTGSISVPKTSFGGKCSLTTSTGSIKIDINN